MQFFQYELCFIHILQYTYTYSRCIYLEVPTKNTLKAKKYFDKISFC